MKVNLVKWANVLDMVESDKEMLNAFVKFYEKLSDVTWSKPNDVMNTFNSTDIINCKNSNRIVFNVGGNKYRLITGYYFGKKLINLYIKFVGTHKEYDKVDVCKINMFKK
jgi:mRNA interferase HigB